MMPNVSVIGLGKLGLTTAACYASKGLKVVGVDVIEENVAAINRGECPIQETGLAELVRRCGPNLRATTDAAEAIRESDVTFIIVPTPSGPDGAFSNDAVNDVLDAIGPALRAKEDFHVVVVTSTVMPGSMENEFRPRLEWASGKVCGRDFGLAYNPEFIALGSIIHDFLNADMILIGESDPRTGDTLETIYRHITESDPAIARMNWISAELTKLSLNCYCTMKISFANAIAQLCERLPGADPYAITDAIGHDSRVGTKYIRPGLGFGGPCFPRDNIAFIKCAGDFGIDAQLSKAVVAINNAQVDHVVEKIQNAVQPGARVAVLGLSYKPGSHVTEASQPFEIARRLAAAGYRVRAYDPQVREAPAQTELVETLEACLAEADACVIATAWEEFTTLRREDLEEQIRPDAIVDCWRMLDESTTAAKLAAATKPAACINAMT